jgi:hypothetical protein
MAQYRVRLRGSIIIPAHSEKEAWEKASEIIRSPDFSLENLEKYSLVPYGHIDLLPDHEAMLFHNAPWEN